MINKIQKNLFLISLIIFITGCVTVGNMEKVPTSGGKTRTYDMPYSKTFETALEACQGLDFKVLSQNMTKKYIVAKNVNFGGLVGIYFKDLNHEQTEVRVIGKARLIGLSGSKIGLEQDEGAVLEEIRNRIPKKNQATDRI
jgi:hypothetical protein